MVTALSDTHRIVLRVNRRKQQVATVIVQQQSTLSSHIPSSHRKKLTMPPALIESIKSPLPDSSLVHDGVALQKSRIQKLPVKTYASRKATRSASKLETSVLVPAQIQLSTPPESAHNSTSDEAQEPPKKRAKKNATVQPETETKSKFAAAPPVEQSDSGRTLRSKDQPKIYQIIPKECPKFPIRFDEPIMVINGPFTPAPRTRNSHKRSAEEAFEEDNDWEYLQPLEMSANEEEIPKEAFQPIAKFDWSQMGKFAKGTTDPLTSPIYAKLHKKWEKMEKETVAAGNRKTEGDIQYLREELHKLQGSRWKDVLKLPRSCSVEELKSAEEERQRLIEVIKSKVQLSDMYAAKFKELVKFENDRRMHSRKASRDTTPIIVPKQNKKRSASFLEVEDAHPDQTKKRARTNECGKAKPVPPQSTTEGKKTPVAQRQPSANPQTEQRKASPVFDSFERDPVRREAFRRSCRTSSRNARPFGQPITKTLSSKFETPTEFSLPEDIIEDGKKYRKLHQ